VLEDPRVLGEADVRDISVTPDDEHVLVVAVRGVGNTLPITDGLARNAERMITRDGWYTAACQRATMCA
jgi:hypothetical protein